jgi:hypothetical protein
MNDQGKKYAAVAGMIVVAIIIIAVIYFWHKHGQKTSFASSRLPRFGAGVRKRGSLPHSARIHLGLGAAAGQPRFGAGVAHRA